MINMYDRIQVAFNNRLGIQVDPAEVKILAEILVYLLKNEDKKAIAAMKRFYQI